MQTLGGVYENADVDAATVRGGLREHAVGRRFTQCLLASAINGLSAHVNASVPYASYLNVINLFPEPFRSLGIERFAARASFQVPRC